MKILIVEDNPANMKLVSDLLKREGHVILEATDADAGIAIARAEVPALILMDIQLPGMDGISALKILKQDEKTRRIKTIALTALAMSGDKERLLDAGFDSYMSKPIRYKELLQTVASLLNKEGGNVST